MITTTRYLVVASAVAAAFTARASLVAGWTMNESSGNIADASGNGLTGTASSGGLTYGQSSVTAGTYGNIVVSSQAAAAFGTSILFTRSGAGSFSVTNSPLIGGLAEAGPSGAFTVMAWVNASLASATTYRIFSTGGSGGWAFGASNVDRMIMTTFGVADTRTTTAPVTNNQWVHLALSWSAGTFTFYANGVAAGTFTTGFLNETASNYAIGSASTLTGENFNGRIDELKIYNTAMTQSEIIAAAVTAIPEPAETGALVAAAGVALSLVRRRRRCTR